LKVSEACLSRLIARKMMHLSRKSEDELRAEAMGEYDQLESIGVTGIDKLLVAFDVYNAARFPEVVKQLSSSFLTVGAEYVRLRENVKLEHSSSSHLYLREPTTFIESAWWRHARVKTEDWVQKVSQKSGRSLRSAGIHPSMARCIYMYV